MRALHGLERPVIAAVDGVAFVAGFSLALLADIVLVFSRARLCMAFGRVGLVPEYGAPYTLPRVVGLQGAKELVFSAREVGAEETRTLGLPLEVYSPERLLARASELARVLAGASPKAMAITKDTLNALLGNELEAMLQLEANAKGFAGTTDYGRAAFRRFADKQPAHFHWPAGPADKR